MDFDLSDKHAPLKTMLASFVDRELVPKAKSHDEEGRFPKVMFEKLASLGLLGITIPGEFGGSDGDMFSAALGMEELARGCGSTALSWATHAILCTHNLYEFGNDSQRRKFLPELCSGKKIGAFALTEPGFGSDAASLSTKAILEGNYYRLTGSKMFITNAFVADIFLTFARTSEKGISLFVVEKSPQVVVSAPFKKLGVRASPTSEVQFCDAKIPVENRLGTEGEGIRLMKRALDTERAVFSGLAVGIGQAAFNESLRYCKERHQFGKPLVDFQLIQDMLARMATDLAAARLLFYKAAHAGSTGKLTTLDASLAKLYVGDMVSRVTNLAIQTLGGYGYICEFPVERFFRDGRLASLGGGTSEIQKLTIARELVKNS